MQRQYDLGAHHQRVDGEGRARGTLKVAFGLTPADADADFAPLLSRLRAGGWAWGVVTNKAARFTLPLTSSLSLFGAAAVIVCGDSTPHLKPHPASLLEAQRQLGLNASQCIYVGDDKRDMQSGRAAGMRTVAARYGYLGEGARTQDWPADAAIDHPLQLLNFLECA